MKMHPKSSGWHAALRTGITITAQTPHPSPRKKPEATRPDFALKLGDNRIVVELKRTSYYDAALAESLVNVLIWASGGMKVCQPEGLHRHLEKIDSILLFFYKENEAEFLVGDLQERAERLRDRKSRSFVLCWLWWNASGLVLRKVIKVARENTMLGRLGEAVIEKLGK